MTQMTSDRAAVMAGRLMSGLVIAVLFADASVNGLAPDKIAGLIAETGFSLGQAPTIGALLLVSVLLYAIPKTAGLGAILITAFLGGAICTHFRIGEVFSPPQIISLLLGVLTWGGLYLRDARFRALMPLRV
jgi:DoxX-like family